MAPRLPSLNSLRAFEAAGRGLSFRAAAMDLGVTQSAVAQQVRALEAHLGIALFRRVPSGLELTEAGRGYHAQVFRAFRQLEAATAEVVPLAEQVTVSVTPTFAAKWLIPRLEGFARALPQIDLRIVATERVSNFHGDGVDIAVRLARPPFAASLRSGLLARQEFMAVCRPDLVGGGVGDLRGQVFLRDSHDLWPRYLALLGAEARALVPRGPMFSQTALCIDAALAGQGVALVPRLFVAADLAAGRLVQALPATLAGERDFWLVAPTAARSGAVEAVWDWFRQTAEAAG